MSHCPHIWPSQEAMKVHLPTCALTSLLLLPVVAVLAARPDPSAVVLDSAALSLGLRDAALRDLFVRTTTIGLFPPLSVSSTVLVSLAQFSLGSVSRSRSLARPSSVREPRVSDVVDLQWLCSARQSGICNSSHEISLI